MRNFMTPSSPYTHIYHLFRYTYSSIPVALFSLDDFHLFERLGKIKDSDKAIQHRARDGERLWNQFCEAASRDIGWAGI